MMKLSNCNSVISKLTLTFLMIITLEGCEVPNKNEIPMPEKPYILRHDTQTYSLSFQGNSNKLSEEEQERLLIAIKPTGPGKASTHITIPNKGSHFGKQRLKHVIRILLADGVKSKQIHKSDKLPPANGNSIEIVLDTYRAIPPLCPNWSTIYGPSYNRGTTSNFGCATAVNFLLMIDDPIILFKGEKALSRDAARDSSAISDYRIGKDKGKWLKNEKADGGSSGSSSSSGSSGSSGSPSGGG